MSLSAEIELLIKTLGVRDTREKAVAASELVRIGAPAVDPLISALTADSHELRSSAAIVLGHIGDIRSIKPLIRMLQIKGTKATYHEHAENALLRIGAPVVKPLCEALKVPQDRKFDASAVTLLAKLGQPAIEPLCELLQGMGSATAIRALVQVGEPAIEPLCGVLSWSDSRSVDRAAEALGIIRDERAVQPLIAVLQDTKQSNPSRVAAADALGKIGDRRAVAPLCIALRDSDTFGLVVHAASALGQIRDRGAVEALCKMSLQISSGRAVISALGEIGDPAALPRLVSALSDPDQAASYLRGDIAIALGRLSDSRAIVPLCIALEDSDREVRKCAARALGSLAKYRSDGTREYGTRDDGTSIEGRTYMAPLSLHGLHIKILVSNQMDLHARIAALNALHSPVVRDAVTGNAYLSHSPTDYCELMLSHSNSDVRRCAKEVLQLLSLLRPSELTGEDLLRTLSETPVDQSGQDLLRHAPEPAPGPLENQTGLLQMLRRFLKWNQ